MQVLKSAREQFEMYRLEAEGRLRRVFADGEAGGGGGVSLETLMLIGGGVLAGGALIAWVASAIANKQATIVP